MKKILLMSAVAIALSFASCNSGDYKSKGQEMAKQLDEAVEQQDTTKTIATDKAIRELEEEIIASGDSVALQDFRDAMKDSRVRNVTFVTLSKIRNGVDKKEAINEVIQDAMKSDVNIGAVTSAIDAILKAEEQQNQQK